MAEFFAPSTEWGVEQDGSWMMVPLNGYNHVCLRDGENMKPNYDRSRIKVELESGSTWPDTVVLKVTGLRYGETQLQFGRGRKIISITVSVKKRIEKTVAFYIVKTAANMADKKYTSIINLSNIDAAVKSANFILDGQANIKIFSKNQGTMEVAENSIRFKNDNNGKEIGLVPDLPALVKTQYPNVKVDVNIFFINGQYGIYNYEKKSTSFRTFGGATSDYKKFFLVTSMSKRSINDYGRTIAHELMHVLSDQKHKHKYHGHLFGDRYSVKGTLMPKDFVNKVNP